MKTNHTLEIIVASDVEYENLISEIYCDGEFIALLQQEDGDDNIKIEFQNNIKPVNYEWLLYALEKAKKDLLNE